MEAVLVSGEAVDADLSAAESVSDVRKIVALSLEVSPGEVQLLHGGTVLQDDAPLALDPEDSKLTVLLVAVDLSLVKLTYASSSECDEGTAYSDHSSVLYYQDNVVWRLSTCVSSNIGGARGSSHRAFLSEDNAKLTVETKNETRSVGERRPADVTREEFCVRDLVLKANVAVS